MSESEKNEIGYRNVDEEGDYDESRGSQGGSEGGSTGGSPPPEREGDG